jgi:hypothetical protein
MTAEIYLVLVEFGQQHERAALNLLIPTLHRLFPAAIVRVAVVDNSMSMSNDLEFQIERQVDRVSGDNSLREFSGWDRGIAWLEQRYTPPAESMFVLANDTVVRKDKHDRVRDLPADRVSAASHGALVGWIDEYPRPVELFGLTLRQWIDTSFVLAAHRTLAALRPFARPLEDTLLFGEWPSIFRDPSPLSENYRGYLKTYFFGDVTDSEFEHGWYAQTPLTPGNFDAFKIKLRCVFCEHLLSARARAAGIPLVDIRPKPLPIDACDVVLSDSGVLPHA